jgi:hypothetical protein
MDSVTMYYLETNFLVFIARKNRSRQKTIITMAMNYTMGIWQQMNKTTFVLLFTS